jgi:hypothetical protein
VVLTKLDALIDNAIALIQATKRAEIEITPPPTAEAALRVFHDLREYGRQFDLFP